MAKLFISLLLIITTCCITVESSNLALTFDATNSTCTAACTACPKESTDCNNEDNTLLINQLLNTTQANTKAIQQTLQQVNIIASTLTRIKNTTITNSGVINDILLLVEELLAIQNESTISPIPTSCQEIKERMPASPSGVYLLDLDGETRYVYCHLEELCGYDEGWTRVAYLDMSDLSEWCPTGFRLYESNGVRACGRPDSSVASCQSVQFPSNGISYSQVCGRVVGYQYGTPDAVHHGLNINDINSYYVDGISLTRGSPRQHIWTFMASRQENIFENNDNLCPCSVGSTQFSNIQSFVGNDYFCESGCPGNVAENTPYFSDPLWDGNQCGSLEQECCKAPGLPWFHKVLNSTTTDYIELRVCADQYTNNEDVPVANFEIYVM